MQNISLEKGQDDAIDNMAPDQLISDEVTRGVSRKHGCVLYSLPCTSGSL